MRKLGRSKRKTWMEQLQLLSKSPYIILRRHPVSCREKNLSQSSQSSNQNVIPAEEENLESQHRGNSEKERPANNLQDIPERSDTQISNAVAETALIGVLDISKTCQGKFQEHNLSSRELSSETIPESNATSSKNTISKSKIYPKTKVDNLIDRNQDVSSSEKRIDLDLIEHVDTSLYQTSITKDVNQTKINLEFQNAQTVSFIEINSKPIIKRKISSESLDRNALMKIQKKNKMNMLSDKIVTDNNIEVLSDNKLEKNTKKKSRVTKYMIRKQENFKLLKQKKEQHKKEMNQKTKNVREKIHKGFKGFSYTDISENKEKFNVLLNYLNLRRKPDGPVQNITTDISENKEKFNVLLNYLNLRRKPDGPVQNITTDISENKEKFNVLLNYLNLRRKPDGPVHNITTEGKIEDIFERNKKLTHNTSVNDNLRKDIDSVIPTKIKSNNLHDFTVSIDKHVIYNTTSNEKTEDTTRRQRIASIEKHSIMYDVVSNKEDATLLCKRDTLTNYNNSQENIKNPVSVIVKFDNSNNSTAYVEHNCLKQNVSTHEEIENGASLHKSDILANNLQENMKRAISVIVKSSNSSDSTARKKNYAIHDITADKVTEDKTSVYKYDTILNNSQENIKCKVVAKEEYIKCSSSIIDTESSSKSNTRAKSSQDITLSTIKMNLGENISVENVHSNQNATKVDTTYAEAEKINMQVVAVNRQEDQDVRNIESINLTQAKKDCTTSNLSILSAHKSTSCGVVKKSGADMSQNIENLLTSNNDNKKAEKTSDQLSMIASTSDNGNNNEIEIEIQTKPKLKSRISQKYLLKESRFLENTCLKNLHTVKDNISFINKLFRTDKISEMSRRGSTSNSSKNNTSLGENENVSVNTENYDITCDFSPTTKDNINDSQQQQRNIQNYPILSETDKRNAIESNQRGRNECTQSANAITENSPESSKLACDISDLRKQVQEALTDDKQKKNKEKQNSQNNTTSEKVINVTGDNQGKENNCISFIEQKKTQLEMLIEAKLIRQNNSGTVAYDTSNIGEQLSQPSSDATHSKVQVQSTKELNCCNDAKSAKLNASASSRSAYSVFCQSASFHSVLPQSAVPQSAISQTAAPQSVPLQLTSLQSALPQTTPQSVPLQLASLQSALPQTTPQSVPLQLAFPQSALLQTVAPQSVPLQLTSLQSALPQTTPQSVPLQLASLQSALPQTTPQSVPLQLASLQSALPQTTPQSVPLQLAFPQSALLQTVAPQSVPFQLTSLLQQPPLHNITVKQVPSEANASVNLNTANIEHLPYIEQILIRRICNNVTQCRDVQNKISFVRLQMQASAKYLVKLLRIHIELNEALQELKVRLRMNDVQCTLAYVNQYKILSRPITVIEINNYIEFIQRYLFYGTQILDKNNVKFDVLQCQNTSGSVPNASMPSVNAQPFSKKKKRVSNHDRSRQSLLHPVSMIPNVDSVNQQQLFDNSANFVQVSHLIQSKPNIRQQYMSYVPSTAHIYMPHANQQQFSENTSYPVQSQYMPSANMSTVGIQQAYVNINKVSSSNTNMGLHNTINQGDAHLSPATNNKETEILELQNKHPGQNKLSSMNSQQDSQHQKTLIAYNVSQNTSDIVSNNFSLQKTSNVQTHSVQNIRPHQNAQPQLRRSQRLMQLQKVLNKEAENIWPHQNVRSQLRRSQRLMQLQKVPNKEAEILELQNKHPGQNKLSSMNSQQDSQHQKILIAYNVSQNTSDTVSNNCTSQKTNNLQNTLCKISSQNLDLPQSALLLLQRKEALGYNFNLEVLTVRQKILLYEQIKSYFLILDQIKYSLNEQECRQILHERSMLLFLFRCLHDYKDLPETIKRCDEKDLQENTSQNKSITEEKTMQISVDELTKIQSSRDNENSSTSNRNLEKQSSEQAIDLSISKNSKPTVVSSNLEVQKEKSLFTESNANETSNVATLNNNGRNDATLSPYSTEDQNKEVSNPSNEIPSENLQDGMCDDVNENIEMLTVTEIQSDLLNTSHDSIPASSNSIRPSISPITKSTEISEVFIIHEELADTISECLNVRQEDSTNERSNNFIEETSESSGKWWLDKNREESQRQEQSDKISSSEKYNLKMLQNSARPFDTITCDSTKVPLSLLKKIVEGADTLKNFVIKAQNTEFNKELLEAKNIISEEISLKFEDEWNMGENTIQPIDIKKNKDTKEEDNEQLLVEEETSCEEMSLKFNISENSSSIEENTVEYILELPEGPEEEKIEIDSHNDIKTIHEQLKHVSEDKYYEKLQPSSCNSIQKDNPIDINVEIFAKNDILNNVECIYMESDSEDMIKPNILNVRSISPTLFEKMENTDTFPQSDLKSLNENDEKLLDYINVNQEISDDVDDMPCLRCRRKSTIYCRACLEAHYCSKRCSSLHWKSDHYKKCKGDTILCVNID